MVDTLEVVAINPVNTFDRLGLCWGHLENWKSLKIVQKSREWLEKANAIFKPTTFIAYTNREHAGMIEFIPNRLLKKLGLCPCRVDKENRETEDRYILGGESENYLFISCLLVNKDCQGKGVGKALLTHLLGSEVFKNSDGALVYARKRDDSWDKYIHWPAGPAEFYLKAGFIIEKTLDNPVGCLLNYRNTHLTKQKW